MSETVRQPKRSRQIIRSRRTSLSSNTGSNNEKKPYTLGSVLDLKLDGWSYRKIADYYGKDVSTIHSKLKRYRRLIDGESIEAFQKHRVKILTAAQQELVLAALDDEKIKKANLGNFFYGFEKLDHAIRLETNQSTANISLHRIIEEIEREEKSKRKQLPPQDPGSGEEIAESERQSKDV